MLLQRERRKRIFHILTIKKSHPFILRMYVNLFRLIFNRKIIPPTCDFVHSSLTFIKSISMKYATQIIRYQVLR